MMPKGNPAAPVKGFSQANVTRLLQDEDGFERLFASLPAWYQNIWIQMGKSISRAHGLSKSEDLRPAMMGTLAGQFAASSKILLRKRPEEASASPKVKKALREARKAFKAIQPNLREIDRRLSVEAESFSILEEAAFAARKARALQKNNAGIDFWVTDATPLYVALILLAPIVPRIRSVRELHEMLCRIMAKTIVGDIKRVEAVCRRIKLSFGPPGRPPKQQPPS